MTPTFSIVIPCRNEGGSLQAVLDDIRAAFAGAEVPEVVVVDDGSSDATGIVAAAHGLGVRIVRHAKPRGYGEAIKSGIAHATGEVVCLMDGDGQHAASDVRRLSEQCLPRTLVVGRRVDQGRGSRRLARVLLRRWSQLISGTDIHDSNSGMMAFPRMVTTRMLPFLPEGMAYSDSLKLLFHLLQMDIVEVPIDVRPRAEGLSKNSIQDGMRTLLSAVVMVVLINPTRVFLPLGLGSLAAGVLWAIPFLTLNRGVPAASVVMILAGLMTLFFGLIFRVLAGLTQSVIMGSDR